MPCPHRKLRKNIMMPDYERQPGTGGRWFVHGLQPFPEARQSVHRQWSHCTEHRERTWGSLALPQSQEHLSHGSTTQTHRNTYWQRHKQTYWHEHSIAAITRAPVPWVYNTDTHEHIPTETHADILTWTYADMVVIGFEDIVRVGRFKSGWFKSVI